MGRKGATLGRRQTNTIAFSHESGGTVMGIDASISGEHARIVYDEEGDFLHIMDGTPTKVCRVERVAAVLVVRPASFQREKLGGCMSVLRETVPSSQHVGVWMYVRRNACIRWTTPSSRGDEERDKSCVHAVNCWRAGV